MWYHNQFLRAFTENYYLLSSVALKALVTFIYFTHKKILLFISKEPGIKKTTIVDDSHVKNQFRLGRLTKYKQFFFFFDRFFL